MKMPIAPTLAALALVASSLPALAQQSSVSTLAADGYEVRAVTKFDLNPTDSDDSENLFMIMQKDESVFGCVLRSSTSSFCERIE